MCGRASLLETVLGLDLEKTHPHCRVELARALALAEAAAVERCLSRTEGERDAACVAGLQLLAAEKGVGFISFLLLAPTPALCAHHRKDFALLPTLSSAGGLRAGRWRRWRRCRQGAAQPRRASREWQGR